MEGGRDDPGGALLLRQVVEEVAKRARRPPQESQQIIRKLEAEWLADISIKEWAGLPAAIRSALKIPLFLRAEFDRLSDQENHDEKKQIFSMKRERESEPNIEKKEHENGKDDGELNPKQSKRQRRKNRKKAKEKENINNNNQAEANLSNNKKFNLNFEELINSNYSLKDFMEKAKKKFREKNGEPFPHLFLKNFFSDGQWLENVKNELMSLKYHPKSNDLYDFLQSDDLKACDKPFIKALKEALYSQDFREWLMSITGITDLNDTVDMSAARYIDKSTLLCHDDELEGRRIAYIIYLVPPDWDAEQDGGTLDLFESDEHGQPNSIVKSFGPQWNSFFFFEVNAVSHHQVSEVLTSDKERLSISGWFHGTPIKRPPPYDEPGPIYISPLALSKKKSDKNLVLKEWINPTYLNKQTKKQIKAQFEEEQSIQLPSFVRADKYQLLTERLLEEDWIFQGPANKRHYQRLPEPGETVPSEEDHTNNNTASKQSKLPSWEISESANGSTSSSSSASSSSNSDNGSNSGSKSDQEDIVRQFKRFMLSRPFCQWLSEITDIKIASCTGQVRCFQKGTYTLVHDGVIEEEALDVVLCCPTNSFPDDAGGKMVYMDEESELLAVDVEPNCLSLVFRDSGTMRFIKYLNHHCSDIRFDFAMIYKE